MNPRTKNVVEIIAAVGLIGILGVMILPIPAGLLDVLLAMNFSIAVLIFMVALYLTEPLKFSVFPGALLIVTLFRLSLNIASTRLILGDAYAGNVILSFGTFVVKGNYVVGLIIFLILVVIQFVVITKGAGRVAEVAARFTLDAMPGKQMSIDADLNAGLIDEQEAKARREKINKEADFYGAMDGASKFVRGDAVAGLIITVINIIGGFIIGIVQLGMSFPEALQTYTILTVGDGLVSQIPAIIISTSAGIVVTKASSDSHLTLDLRKQFLANPKVLYLTALILLLFGVTPGLPAFPFMTLAGMVGLAAWASGKGAPGEAEVLEEPETPEEPAEGEEIEYFLQVDPIEVEIGYGLIPLVDRSRGGDLLHRITEMRKKIAFELGFVVPPIRIRDNLQIDSEEYVLKVKGVDVGRSTIRMGHLLALDPGEVEGEIRGVRTTDPVYGLNAVWIRERQREEAERMGYTVIYAAGVITTHLAEIIRRHAHEILGRQDVQNMLDKIKAENPALMEDLAAQQITLGTIHKIIQNLLREDVPIRDALTILETLADYAPTTKDPGVLTEYVRKALSRVIYDKYRSPDGAISAITLDPQLENQVMLALTAGEDGTKEIPLPPELVQGMCAGIRRFSDEMTRMNLPPVLLCSMTIRSVMSSFLRTFFDDLAVLSYNELPPNVEVRSCGVVRVQE
jgi:flagellar biosynthesis protein FlhA